MGLRAQYLSSAASVLVIVLYGSLVTYAAFNKRPEKQLCYANAALVDVQHHRGKTYVNSELFDGVLYLLYPNGDTQSSYTYAHGLQEGIAAEWFENGKPATKRSYKAGKKHGLQRGWFEDGKPAFVYHCCGDMYHGNVKEWLPNGILFKDFNYKNGLEDGMQRMYWEDGSLRANYQVVNGRKYGLTGVKNCISASH